MADLSFIEDSVAFPEKEEDEEEEEEGVEWGYEEGNPPRVRRLARGVGPAALARSPRLRRPSLPRGSPAGLGAAGAAGRAGVPITRVLLWEPDLGAGQRLASVPVRWASPKAALVTVPSG